ncbi:unnamed protein product [Timema podura]|uniref:Uncharacterized protein n=1 Tax=Timema podura TaxID=61482 RepID=A0ABN7NYV4_TIMPD|nr:unnamed protein product [Timema podura]
MMEGILWYGPPWLVKEQESSPTYETEDLICPSSRKQYLCSLLGVLVTMETKAASRYKYEEERHEDGNNGEEKRKRKMRSESLVDRVTGVGREYLIILRPGYYDNSICSPGETEIIPKCELLTSPCDAGGHAQRGQLLLPQAMKGG